MFSLSQQVQAIDDAITGTVIRVDGDCVLIETEDGFEMEFRAHQLIPSGNQLEAMKNTKTFHSPNKDLNLSKKKKVPVKTKKNEFVLEVDLHIEKLIPSHKNMSNFDILNLQVETAKRQLDFAISKRFPKVIFIHGVGDGVLKEDLRTMLRKYEGIQYQDANYHTYGLGATEVMIFQK